MSGSAEGGLSYAVPKESSELEVDDLDEEQKKLLELQPPSIDSYVPFRVDEEPEEKPRKGGKKKYNPDEKWINKNPVAEKDASAEDNAERQYALLDFIIQNLFLGLAEPRALQQPIPVHHLVLNKGEYIPSPQRRVEDSKEEEVIFQIRGREDEENAE